MDDLIRSSESKYDEYEKLIILRDQLSKEANQIWTVYLKMFGELITENYEEKIECIKCKKTIAYYQSVINRGGTVSAKDMQEYLDREMAEYYKNLRKMTKDNKLAKEAGVTSEYEARRSKELYRRLAKLIHPDLNPATDRSQELKELWQRILIAYGKNSVKELSELEVLVRKVMNDLGIENVKADIPDISGKIEDLTKEIEDIKSSEPYTLRSLVEDEEAANKKKDELTEETEQYRKYRKELGEVIIKMITEGGLHLYVE